MTHSAGRLFIEQLNALAKRETHRRYKDTLVGWLWIILVPILQSAVIAFFFVRFVGLTRQSPNSPYLLIVLSGYTVWNYVSHTVSQAMSAFTSNMDLINTQPLPLILLPLTNTWVKTLDWVVSLVMFAVVTAFMTGSLPTSFWLGLLPFGLALAMFVSSLAILAALAGSLVRDIGHLVSLLLSLWFWISPIFYPAHLIPSALSALNLNPLMHFLAAFRQISLEGILDLEKLSKLLIVSAGCLLLSLLLYRRLAWRIYDRA